MTKGIQPIPLFNVFILSNCHPIPTPSVIRAKWNWSTGKETDFESSPIIGDHRRPERSEPDHVHWGVHPARSVWDNPGDIHFSVITVTPTLSNIP